MFNIPGLSTPILYGAITVTAALFLALGVQEFRVVILKGAVAAAEKNQAIAETTAAKVNEIFAREEAGQERRRAEQAEANAKELKRLQDARDTIETRYRIANADRAKLSAENKRYIANAPKSDSRDLGPTMLNYFVCLREQQQAARAASSTPASGERCRRISLSEHSEIRLGMLRSAFNS